MSDAKSKLDVPLSPLSIPISEAGLRELKSIQGTLEDGSFLQALDNIISTRRAPDVILPTGFLKSLKQYFAVVLKCMIAQAEEDFNKTLASSGTTNYELVVFSTDEEEGSEEAVEEEEVEAEEDSEEETTEEGDEAGEDSGEETTEEGDEAGEDSEEETGNEAVEDRVNRSEVASSLSGAGSPPQTISSTRKAIYTLLSVATFISAVSALFIFGSPESSGSQSSGSVSSSDSADSTMLVLDTIQLEDEDSIRVHADDAADTISSHLPMSQTAAIEEDSTELSRGSMDIMLAIRSQLESQLNGDNGGWESQLKIQEEILAKWKNKGMPPIFISLIEERVSTLKTMISQAQSLITEIPSSSEDKRQDQSGFKTLVQSFLAQNTQSMSNAKVSLADRVQSMPVLSNSPEKNEYALSKLEEMQALLKEILSQLNSK